MDKYEKLKQKFRGGRPLSDKEVQDLRDKAVEYKKQGGNYLGKMESK